ncbi:hypothetical protein S83_051112, partial [Arachis hypogaea]
RTTCIFRRVNAMYTLQAEKPILCQSFTSDEPLDFGAADSDSACLCSSFCLLLVPLSFCSAHYFCNCFASSMVIQFSSSNFNAFLVITIPISVPIPQLCTFTTTILLQLDPFLNELTSMFEQSTETGSVWVTLEDASLQALGDRKGINRFGDFSAPLDEALIHASLDLSGRPHLSYNLDIPTQRVGTYDAQGVQKQLPVGASRVTLLVRNLKKKSLWSRILEEVMEKLVDIVYFLHLEIHEAFGSAGAFKNYK